MINEITLYIREGIGEIWIQSPHNKRMISELKSWGATWDGDCWMMPLERGEELKKLCIEIYGHDGRTQKTVTAHVDVGGEKGIPVDYWDDSIYVFGAEAIGLIEATRWKPSTVRLSPLAKVISGSLPAAENSRINMKKPLTLEVEAPESSVLAAIEKYGDSVRIVSVGAIDRRALLVEASAIEHRLKEIRDLLKNNP